MTKYRTPYISRSRYTDEENLARRKMQFDKRMLLSNDGNLKTQEKKENEE